jgi:hypothetical protein
LEVNPSFKLNYSQAVLKASQILIRVTVCLAAQTLGLWREI